MTFRTFQFGCVKWFHPCPIQAIQDGTPPTVLEGDDEKKQKKKKLFLSPVVRIQVTKKTLFQPTVFLFGSLLVSDEKMKRQVDQSKVEALKWKKKTTQAAESHSRIPTIDCFDWIWKS